MAKPISQKAATRGKVYVKYPDVGKTKAAQQRSEKMLGRGMRGYKR